MSTNTGVKKSTKKMLKSNPDKKGVVSNEPVKVRYTDQELEEFKKLINIRIERARNELQFLNNQISGKDEDRHLTVEDGTAARELEQVGQLASRQILLINNLEKALVRIMNKTYGICRETGKLIDKARLKAVPHATLSIEAKKK